MAQYKDAKTGKIVTTTDNKWTTPIKTTTPTVVPVAPTSTIAPVIKTPVTTPIKTPTVQQTTTVTPVVEKTTTPITTSVVQKQPQAITIPKTTEQKTTIDKPTNLGIIGGKNIISEAPTYKGADGQTYKTVRFEDGKMGTARVNVETGVSDLVGGTYGEEKRNEAKQIVEQGLNNTENIFNQLQSGTVLPDIVKKTNQYQNAEKRYNDVQKYSLYSEQDFGQILKDGLLLEGSQTYNDLVKNPEIKQKIEKAKSLNIVNGVKTDYSKNIENTRVDLIKTEKEILQNSPMGKALSDGYISAEEMNSFTSNADTERIKNTINSLTQEYQSKQNEYTTALSNYEDIERQIREEYKGSGISEASMQNLVSSKQKNILPSLNLMERELGNTLNYINSNYDQLKSIKSELANNFDMNMKLYQTEQSKIDSQTQLQEQRAYDEELATKKLEQQYAYTYGDINSENPTLQNIAIERAIGDMYEKYPIPGMESQAMKVAKVQERMAQGMTGSEAVASVEAEIRGSQRYSDYLQSESNKLKPKVDFTTFNDNLYRVDSDGNISLAIEGMKEPMKWQKLDDGTYVDPNGNIVTKAQIDQTATQVSMPFSIDGLNKTMQLAEKNNVQCGKLVNTYIEDLTGQYGSMGDKYETKVKTIENIGKSNGPQVGGVFAFPYTPASIGYNTGHTGIVKAVNPDGSIVVVEANREGSKNGGTTKENTYSAASVKNMVFSRSLQKQGGGESVGNSDYKTNAIPKYDNFLKTGKVGTNAEEFKQIIKEFGSEENFRKEAENYNNSNSGPRQRELDKIVKLKEQVVSFISDEKKEVLDNSVGTTKWTFPLTSQRREKEDYLADIQNFLDGKTLQQLIDVKDEGATFGALSNEELRMLQNSASKLNQLAIRNDDKDPNKITDFRGSVDNFKKIARETIEQYEKVIEKKKSLMNKGSAIPNKDNDPLGVRTGVSSDNDPLGLLK